MMTLKELRKELSKIIIGQDNLINIVSITLYRHLLKTEFVKSNLLRSSYSNLLIIGATGTGKTYSVIETCKLLNFPLIEINCKSICQEGWYGRSLGDLISAGLRNLSGDTRENNKIVVFLDEFDKICVPNHSNGGENNVNYHLQTSILKYIEGQKIECSSGVYNTLDFCFIFSGAFVDLFDKPNTSIGFTKINDEERQFENELETRLLKFGMIEELLGRITRIVRTNNFTRETYRELLFNESAIFNQWFSIFNRLQIPYKAPNYSAIITKALEINLGARGLARLMEPIIDNIIEENSICIPSIK